MPGPLATNRTSRSAAPNSPSRKVAKRLAMRRSLFQGGESDTWEYRPNTGGGMMTFHRPGSQNRKK